MTDKEMIKTLQKLKKKQEKSKLLKMTVPRPWPPSESVLKRWSHMGLDCAVVQGPQSLCGYVKVPPKHPAHGKWFDDVDVEVHGGLTFCQLSEDGMWFGFDCAHYGDFIATENTGEYKPGQLFWSIETVAKEVKSLARQLAKQPKEEANESHPSKLKTNPH